MCVRACVNPDRYMKTFMNGHKYESQSDMLKGHHYQVKEKHSLCRGDGCVSVSVSASVFAPNATHCSQSVNSLFYPILVLTVQELSSSEEPGANRVDTIK